MHQVIIVGSCLQAILASDREPARFLQFAELRLMDQGDATILLEAVRVTPNPSARTGTLPSANSFVSRWPRSTAARRGIGALLIPDDHESPMEHGNGAGGLQPFPQREQSVRLQAIRGSGEQPR